MEIVPLPALRDNYIWLIREGEHCAVVDPGDATPVLDYLRREGLGLAAILVTHRHNDHIGGIASLLAHHDVPVFGPASIAAVTHPLQDGDTLQAAGLMLTVREVPGHTEEHIAYLGSDFVFCGDTLFSAGCGRILGSATAAQFHASLGVLASLPDDTALYCTHEYTLANLRFAQAVEPDNAELVRYAAHCAALREQGLPTLPAHLGTERAINPFLRCAEPSVQASVARHASLETTSPPAVFAALRAWKDVF